MNLHLVGGFLGSGKTTAIASAARLLMQDGLRVGVITNDQGKYLVDTAFFALNDIPAVEVTGGCFCCNYDDLEARLTQLSEQARPDVIFAESVGSCADIVATVVKPLLALRGGQNAPASLTVFADARLLRLHLLGHPLPFNEDVIYIFDQQIAEAGLLVINKVDLLAPEQAAATLTLAGERWPEKHLRLQNSLDGHSVAEWVRLIQGGGLALPQASLRLDYARYGRGEADLAWLDQAVWLRGAADTDARRMAQHAIGAIADAIHTQNLPVGHLKFLVENGQQRAKISFPTLEAPGWEALIPPLSGPDVRLLINARVQAGAGDLRALVQEALTRAARAGRFTWEAEDVDAFHPGQPNPTHRIA